MCRTPIALSLLALASLHHLSASAQCTVTSTTGYTVHINVQPFAIQPTTTSCPWGYNYTTRLAYDVKFTGENAPSSLSTMQGTITCNGTSQFFDLPNGPAQGEVVSANTWSSLTNCATANPVNMNCNVLRIEIQGVGISSRTITCPTTPTALPVSLLSWDAAVEHDAVALTWSTATEQRNAYFTVERSTDGKEFHTLTTVEGAGDSQSTRHYRAVDTDPLHGTSYYRLLQTDHDGTLTTFDVVPVHFKGSGKEARVVPNPVVGRSFVLRDLDQVSTVEIRDLSGKLVHRAGRSDLPIALPAMPRGVYVVHLQPLSGAPGQAIRLVKE